MNYSLYLLLCQNFPLLRHTVFLISSSSRNKISSRKAQVSRVLYLCFFFLNTKSLTALLRTYILSYQLESNFQKLWERWKKIHQPCEKIPINSLDIWEQERLNIDLILGQAAWRCNCQVPNWPYAGQKPFSVGFSLLVNVIKFIK